MAETTDIEKKSLEAHVELCAERYKFLESKLETVDAKITALEGMLRELHDMMHNLGKERNDQIINWGMGVMAILLGIVGYLLAVYVVK
jgi:chromosome segregation ATPase